ncbi:piggyBac transposable element-derived protein 3-like [Aphis gossypii]|uniref:piggyBac transposable element-derived protein 3-like n=1 Tax=Aphis gossypii TaxID=80765 RepID=UPI002159459B|nr:piggyBac transposable element-derived protein 3-like [Aphis gossypii]
MDFSFENGFSLSKALDILLNEDIEGNIFIEPPYPHVESDGDSADEDGSGFVHNLSSRQLLANAEIRFQNNERLCVNYEVSQNNISQVHTTRETSSIVGPNQSLDKYKKWMSTRIKSKRKPCWIKEVDFDIETATVFPKPDYSKYQNMSITEIFEKFIDDEIIQHFVEETKNYALFLNCPDSNITANEIRCFLAIFYVSGYNDLPSKRHYWNNGDDMKNIAVSQSMRRDRCLQICQFFTVLIIQKLTRMTKVGKFALLWKC